MTLGEVLTARAENARARETVELGALGTVTLEALPVRDLERLMRGADSERAVFYAACRELQRVGAELLQAGKVSRPDQVVALVSDGEAAKAAETVRTLSGWSDAEDAEQKDADDSPEKQTAKDGAHAEKDADTSGQVSHESEIRPDSVQENAEVRRGVVQNDTDAENGRLDVVRAEMTALEKIRPFSVQLEMRHGQVSGEFLTENGEAGFSTSRPQRLPEEMANGPQNVAVSDNSDGGLRNVAKKIWPKKVESSNSGAEPLHENKSENGVSLHEIESENETQRAVRMHEGESEKADGLHEMKSEQRSKKVESLHEIESESTGTMHETESDSADKMHEIESEQQRETVEAPHETTSELAERVAQELLEGLRRAAWVR